jgi:hypothetical protein
MMGGPHVKKVDSRWRIRFLHMLQEVRPVCKTRNQFKINDRWGEFVITPALMLGMEDIILDRISFRGVKELQEIYE